jgi:phosphoesterase RecJ-like protein
VAALLDDARGLVVTSHRNPDGDALGSALGLGRALRAAGRDVEVWHPEAAELPQELRFLVQDGEIRSAVPADAATRTLVALDSATADRVGAPPHEIAARVVNIDHHHDNTRFGDLNMVDGGASSSAEMVVRVLDAAGLSLTPQIAEPLYVGLVTDTGRFSYSNTTPAAHAVAGRLIAAGIDLPEITRRLFGEQPMARLLLTGRALSSATPLAGGRLLIAFLDEGDFRAVGAAPGDTEGIVEMLRSVEGVEVAALARGGGKDGIRVSLRAASERVDVSAIARSEDGGGHRAAAGFTSHRSREDLTAFLEAEVTAQLAGSAGA